MSDKPRKSLRQLADEAAEAEGEDPWACPRCGCKDWRVTGTYERNGKRRRQRVCRNCKQMIRTYEVPVPPGYDVAVVRKTSGSDERSNAELTATDKDVD